MARLSTVVIFLLAASTSTVAVEEVRPLGFLEGKFYTIKVESAAAASAIQNITVQTPVGKLQLANMAADFIAGLSHAAYHLNIAIPNIDETKKYTSVVATALKLGNLINSLQQVVSGDSSLLKERLVLTLEELNHAASQDNFNFIGGDDNRFINIQLKAELDAVVYAIYKLKYRAIFFKQTNKQLVPEIRSVLQFAETIKLLSGDNNTDERLREALLLASVLTSRDVYKLNNWIEVNSNTSFDIKVVQDVAELLSKLYVKQISLLSLSRSNGIRVELEFMKVLGSIIALGTELANVEYVGKLGGPEFIRSTLLDIISFGKFVADNARR